MQSENIGMIFIMPVIQKVIMQQGAADHPVPVGLQVQLPVEPQGDPGDVMDMGVHRGVTMLDEVPGPGQLSGPAQVTGDIHNMLLVFLADSEHTEKGPAASYIP